MTAITVDYAGVLDTLGELYAAGHKVVSVLPVQFRMDGTVMSAVQYTVFYVHRSQR